MTTKFKKEKEDVEVSFKKGVHLLLFLTNVCQLLVFLVGKFKIMIFFS